MIESIYISDESTAGSHVFRCPALRGRTFQFYQGLNLVCGYNGCGKSSLLTLMRRLTFCDQRSYSGVSSDEEFRIQSMIEDGLYDRVTLKNDWRKSVFSLHGNLEISSENFEDSFENFSKTLSHCNLSSGMESLISMNELAVLLRDLKSEDDVDLPNYAKHVMEVPIYGTSISRSKSEYCRKIQDYQSANHVENEGLTVILDEPDRSLDIFYAASLVSALTPKISRACKNSYICVLHNPVILYRLLKEDSNPHIHWIELTPGYLDNVRSFVETGAVQKPERSSWLCEKA